MHDAERASIAMSCRGRRMTQRENYRDVLDVLLILCTDGQVSSFAFRFKSMLYSVLEVVADGAKGQTPSLCPIPTDPLK